MNVNLTLVVQIIHTIIAYIIIERVLLRPLFGAYCRDKKEKQDLVDNVESLKSALASRESAQHDQWQGLKSAFKQREPASISKGASLLDGHTPSPETVSHNKVQEATSFLKSRIFKRLIHD